MGTLDGLPRFDHLEPRPDGLLLQLLLHKLESMQPLRLSQCRTTHRRRPLDRWNPLWHRSLPPWHRLLRPLHRSLRPLSRSLRPLSRSLHPSSRSLHPSSRSLLPLSRSLLPLSRSLRLLGRPLPPSPRSRPIGSVAPRLRGWEWLISANVGAWTQNLRFHRQLHRRFRRPPRHRFLHPHGCRTSG